MKDSERIWHSVHTSNENTKPMLGKFSGTSVVVLLASVGFAMLSFFILTKELQFSLLSAAGLAGVFPLTTMAVLLCLVVGKPKGYAFRWIQYKKLKRAQDSLLTEIDHNEK